MDEEKKDEIEENVEEERTEEGAEQASDAGAARTTQTAKTENVGEFRGSEKASSAAGRPATGATTTPYTAGQAKCEVCGVSFNSRERLNEHNRDNHPNTNKRR